MSETEVDCTDAVQAAEWKLAQEKSAAQTAEFTWSEKELADASAPAGLFKDEFFYHRWKIENQTACSNKRSREEVAEGLEDDQSIKKMKGNGK